MPKPADNLPRCNDCPSAVICPNCHGCIHTGCDCSPMDALWSDQQGGEILCGHDGGSYLQSAIKADPTATTHLTPLGLWVRVTPQDRAEWPTDLGPMDCETGRHSPQRARCKAA